MATTLNQRIEIAKSLTSRTANTKDWQIRNKHNRAMREIAREWTDSKGYIIASVKELSVKYGQLCHFEANMPDVDKKRVWAVVFNQTWKKLQFAAI